MCSNGAVFLSCCRRYEGGFTDGSRPKSSSYSYFLKQAESSTSHLFSTTLLGIRCACTLAVVKFSLQSSPAHVRLSTQHCNRAHCMADTTQLSHLFVVARETLTSICREWTSFGDSQSVFVKLLPPSPSSVATSATASTSFCLLRLSWETTRCVLVGNLASTLPKA